jgi:predicted transcriptional regulator
MSKTVSIRLEENLLSDLGKIAKITDRSKAWLMSKAVEQYVEQESWQIKAIEATLKKVKNGEAKFHSHESVSNWLESWGNKNETPAPQIK